MLWRLPRRAVAGAWNLELAGMGIEVFASQARGISELIFQATANGPAVLGGRYRTGLKEWEIKLRDGLRELVIGDGKTASGIYQHAIIRIAEAPAHRRDPVGLERFTKRVES